MTSQEAKQQIESSERQITEAYSNLLSAARNVGSSAGQKVMKTAPSNYALPIILFVIGFILCFVAFPIGGNLLCLGVVILVYKRCQAKSPVKKKVMREQERLFAFLNDHTKI